MARVTSKRQVTIPKAIADRYGIQPGDEIEFLGAGEGIRVRLTSPAAAIDRKSRLELFDRATARQLSRQRKRRRAARDRGWRREDLYEGARAR